MTDYIDLNLILFDGDLAFPEETMKPIRESIEAQGLHHPLLVVEDGYTVGGSYRLAEKYNGNVPKYKLLAGKKRLLALKQLGTKEAPVKIYPSSLTQDQQFEITLHENLRRHNLPWYEQVEMELKLHNVKLNLAGPTESNGRRGRPRAPWSQADTARELGISTGQLSEDLDLARAVAVNPSLSRVKDRETALKLIKVQKRRSETEAFSLLPDEGDFQFNQVFLGDSLEVLKQIPSNIFDACITDPPWSVYDRDESLTASQKDLLPIFSEVYRVLKSDSFLYLITCSADLTHYWQELPKLGFQLQAYPLIWLKDHTITHGRRNWQYARDYEPIIVAVKGNPVLTGGTEKSSVLKYRNLHYTAMSHPHEKPIELLEQLIGDSTFVGGKILDCFAGSGVTLEAAKKMERGYIGIEKDKKFFEGIVRRLL